MTTVTSVEEPAHLFGARPANGTVRRCAPPVARPSATASSPPMAMMSS